MNSPKYFKEKPLKPLLKWPGGKTSDLKHLRENYIDLFPKTFNNYFEPFLGGGSAWLTIDSKRKTYVNDLCKDLIDFYNCIKCQDADFFNYINIISQNWITMNEIAKKYTREIYKNNLKCLDDDKFKIIPLIENEKNYLDYIKKFTSKKIKHIKKIEEKHKRKLIGDELLSNVDCSLKSAYYMYLRNLYNNYKENNKLNSSLFYFIRDYCFSSMFRFNKNGDFNVPYGGISYNKRMPNCRMKYWNSKEIIDHMEKTIFFNSDFEMFFKKYKPKKNDFIFIDPPYDSEFSTYDKNVFNLDDQKRLSNFLINGTNSQFMAVMKNTDFIYNLYSNQEDKNIHYKIFNKNYTVSFKNRNEKEVEHIVCYRIYN